MLKFLISDGLFESEMKEIYSILKQIKFNQSIKSLKIRAIPHESLKAVYMYTEWIYSLFFEEALADTREMPQPFEIKFTHFHTANWFFYFISFDFNRHYNLGWMV